MQSAWHVVPAGGVPDTLGENTHACFKGPSLEQLQGAQIQEASRDETVKPIKEDIQLPGCEGSPWVPQQASDPPPGLPRTPFLLCGWLRD